MRFPAVLPGVRDVSASLHASRVKPATDKIRPWILPVWISTLDGYPPLLWVSIWMLLVFCFLPMAARLSARPSIYADDLRWIPARASGEIESWLLVSWTEPIYRILNNSFNKFNKLTSLTCARATCERIRYAVTRRALFNYVFEMRD